MTLSDRRDDRLATVDVVLNLLGDLLGEAERDASYSCDYCGGVTAAYSAVRASRLAIYSQDVEE